MNWLVTQIGEMTFVGLAPQGTPPEAIAALRAAYAEAANDPEFVAQSVKVNGLPYSFVNVERGKQIFGSLAAVSPQVLATLKTIIEPK
jgi:tripartite-type tricarboxylate transporter receptor subunit TctC